MNPAETARIIAMVATIDHRIPPLNTDGPDERVPVWQTILDGLDYHTVQQGIVELARDPGLVAIRPGDVYQATKRVMRRNLDRADIAAIEPPDNATGEHYLAWKRALVRALGRGSTPADARAEADQTVGATRRQIEPTPGKPLHALLAAQNPPDVP